MVGREELPTDIDFPDKISISLHDADFGLEFPTVVTEIKTPVLVILA